MLSGDVPERKERDKNHRDQPDSLFVVQHATLIELKQRRQFEDTILDGHDRMSPEFDVFALLAQPLLFRRSTLATRQRPVRGRLRCLNRSGRSSDIVK